jgi:hypothetical protein
MTNAQAQAYAIIALRNLLREKGWHAADIKDYCKYLDREMYDLMDIMSEEEAEQKANRILQGECC